MSVATPLALVVAVPTDVPLRVKVTVLVRDAGAGGAVGQRRGQGRRAAVRGGAGGPAECGRHLANHEIAGDGRRGGVVGVAREARGDDAGLRAHTGRRGDARQGRDAAAVGRRGADRRAIEVEGHRLARNPDVGGGIDQRCGQ